jgi:hypothetical protein
MREFASTVGGMDAPPLQGTGIAAESSGKRLA